MLARESLPFGLTFIVSTLYFKIDVPILKIFTTFVTFCLETASVSPVLVVSGIRDIRVIRGVSAAKPTFRVRLRRISCSTSLNTRNEIQKTQNPITNSFTHP